MNLTEVYRSNEAHAATLHEIAKGCGSLPEAIRKISAAIDVDDISGRVQARAGVYVGYKIVLTPSGQRGHVVLPGLGAEVYPWPL